MDAKRSKRFGDFDDSLVAYFPNEHSQARMDMVRESIIDVRKSWQTDGVAGLQRLKVELFDESLAKVADSELLGRVQRIFSRERNWYEYLSDGAKSELDTEVVWLYTHNEGYDVIFGAVYRVFRAKGPVREQVRDATSLVEMLNIDLYNHWKTNPEVRDYRGTVYRGMGISPATFESFRELAKRPIGKRAFSIPLGLNSSSAVIESAIPFMQGGIAKNPSSIPILQRIRIHGLSPDRLAAYRACYPESVVSTICAVPIGHLSEYPSEAEVLLRGPFFELVGIGEHPTLRIYDKPVQVLDLVMMNSNRDHPSTPQSGPSDPARKLFNALVSSDKLDACASLAEELGLAADSPIYRTLAEQALAAAEAAQRMSAEAATSSGP